MQGSGDMAQGIALAQQGRREAAYARLHKALFSEGDAAELRLWLAETAPTTAERVQHLEQAAALEPGRPQVIEALTAARAQWAGEARAPVAPPAPPPTGAAPWPRPVQVTPGSGSPAPSPFAGGAAPLPPPTAAPAGEFDWFAQGVASETPPAAPPPAGPVRPHAVGEVLRGRSPAVRRPTGPLEESARPSSMIYSGSSPAVNYPEPSPYPAPASAPPEAAAPPRYTAAGAPVSPSNPVAYNVTTRPAALPPAMQPRRRIMPALLGLLVLLLLLGGGAFVLLRPSGRSSTGIAPAGPAVDAAAPATATAAAVAVRATAAALPTLTAQAVNRAYSDTVTALISQIRDNDRDVADTVHQAGSGVLTPAEATTRIQGYVLAGRSYKSAVSRLVAPPPYISRRGLLLTALDARAQALDTATAYVDKLSQIPDATKADSAAAADFQAAQQAAQRNPSDLNIGKLIQTRRLAETAQAALSRLQTYTDQTQQQFDTEWSAYNAALPPAP